MENAEASVAVQDVAQLIEQAREAGSQTYLLVDAAQSPEISTMVEALTDDALCLFDGEAQEDLATVAPWLVPLSADGDVYDWYMSDGWGNDWGIVLCSNLSARKLKTSLKRAIMVVDEDQREMYFKFYRPSVFREYLPVFEAEQCLYVMRDVGTVWVEHEEATDQVLAFEMHQQQLKMSKITLTAS